MVIEISQVLGWTATTLFSLMLLPQIIKTIKSKNTDGVSLLLFVIYLTANFIALAYALMIDQNPLKIKYTIGIVTTIFYISIYFVYNSRQKRNKLKL